MSNTGVIRSRSCTPKAVAGVSRHSRRRASAFVVAAGTTQHACASAPSTGRRWLLLSSLAEAALLLQPAITPRPAAADVVTDALRSFTRPDVGVQDAVVILMDAKRTLKEIQDIAVTPADSQERFRARAFWPAYAKRLRAVAEAAPVVAGVVTGAADKEEMLGEYYGGKAQGAGVADAVYQGLGRVLTISGRTIRLEAQVGPEAAAGAEQAIDGFLQKVPPPLLEAAQQFRVDRAKTSGVQ